MLCLLLAHHSAFPRIAEAVRAIQTRAVPCIVPRALQPRKLHVIRHGHAGVILMILQPWRLSEVCKRFKFDASLCNREDFVESCRDLVLNSCEMGSDLLMVWRRARTPVLLSAKLLLGLMLLLCMTCRGKSPWTTMFGPRAAESTWTVCLGWSTTVLVDFYLPFSEHCTRPV